MKITPKNPPRQYKVGKDQKITISDMGAVHLNTDEQLTFMTENNQEYDLCRKDWGYYATPSVNDRLKRFGFKTAIVKNSKGQVYVMLVESDKIDIFNKYLVEENNRVIKWLDEEPLEA
jgi:hypothetical protein